MQLRYQNIPERIAALETHLKSRRGRRDRTALYRLVELKKFLERRDMTSATFDEILKHIYTDVNVPPDRILMWQPPTFAMLKKDSRFEDRPRYVQPLEKKP